MYFRFIALSVVIAICLANSAQAESVTVSITNASQDYWAEAPVVVKWDGQKPAPKSAGEGSSKLPVQADDLNGDGKIDEVVFLASLKAGETKKFVLSGDAPTTTTEPRAHTGMYNKTPEMRGFEGPGWESDRIAYRIYWDARNATDVFAKTQPILSMKEYAKKEVNYHRLSKWGMDVLKVKTAVGIGGFGAFIDGKVEKVAHAKREFKVVADGPIRAICDLVYTDWTTTTTKMNLTARMSIYAGQNWTECELTAKSLDGKPLPELICGFVKHAEETTLVEGVVEGVQYTGRWGNQALGEGEVLRSGNLGLGILAEKNAVAAGEDDVNHYFRLKARDGKATYRYLANWYKEPGAASSPEEFKKMLEYTGRLHPQVKIER